MERSPLRGTASDTPEIRSSPTRPSDDRPSNASSPPPRLKCPYLAARTLRLRIGLDKFRSTCREQMSNFPYPKRLPSNRAPKNRRFPDLTTASTSRCVSPPLSLSSAAARCSRPCGLSHSELQHQTPSVNFCSTTRPAVTPASFRSSTRLSPAEQDTPKSAPANRRRTQVPSFAGHCPVSYERSTSVVTLSPAMQLGSHIARTEKV